MLKKKKKYKVYIIFDANKQPLVYFTVTATAQLTDFNNCWLIENSLFGEDKGSKAICFQHKKVTKFILSLLNKPKDVIENQKEFMENNKLHTPATPCTMKSFKVISGEHYQC